MNKAESKFFQSFKERTGKNASKLTVAEKRKAKNHKASTSPRGPRAKSTVAELRDSFETLQRNCLDLREKFEAKNRELRLLLLEERETVKKLRKEIKALRGKAG